MIIVFIIGGPFIKLIESHKITGPIRDDGPIGHIFKKEGTPTMGGLLILIGILFGTLLWADLNNSYIWILLLVVTSFGLLGVVDDYLKIKHNNSRGISSGMKIILQIVLSTIAVILMLKFGESDHLENLYFPFFKNLTLHLGLFFIPFAIFIIVGSSNAVNLTDGLDGLATVPVMLVALSFTLICYVVGNTVFSD
jgi:phospho-N-acetylmuramoyl-pentapeptide-transferase